MNMNIIMMVHLQVGDRISLLGVNEAGELERRRMRRNVIKMKYWKTCFTIFYTMNAVEVSTCKATLLFMPEEVVVVVTGRIANCTHKYWVPDEKNWCVVPHKIPVAIFSVELHGKATRVKHSVSTAILSACAHNELFMRHSTSGAYQQWRTSLLVGSSCQLFQKCELCSTWWCRVSLQSTQKHLRTSSR